jgi:putative heme-binding domain-containing protein
MIHDLLVEVDRRARDSHAALDDRQRAVELIVCGRFDRASGVLEAMLEPRQPQNLQLAAVRGLSGYRDEQVPRLLLRAYRGLTPAVRGEAMQTLLARAEWIEPLVEAIEAQLVSAADIPPARRSLLLKHAQQDIRAKAAAIFAGTTPANRAEVIARYRSALSIPGDPARGQKVIERECLVCHRLGDKGHDVGPNLLSIRHRSPDEVLAQVLDPNREVAPNFVEYIVARNDGRTATGIVVAETATSITLRRPEGQQETILRDEIDSIGGSGRSLMPEGLEQRIAPDEMADLLALLLGRR